MDLYALTWVAWNTFLAAIPIVLALAFSRLAELREKTALTKFGMVAVALAWLAFLPNTCYLLTEWRHYLYRLDARNLYLQSQLDAGMTLDLMRDTVFYFCYSGIGMLAFALAVRPMARVASKNGVPTWVLGVPLFLLLSVGVYLGLVLRYNSWDLLARPAEVWASIADLAGRPRLTAFIVLFGGFLWLAYLAIDVWIDGLLLRLGRERST